MGERKTNDEEFEWLVEMCELTPSHEQHHSAPGCIPFLRQFETSLLPSSDLIRVSSSQIDSHSNKKLKLSQSIDVVVLDDSDSDQFKDDDTVVGEEGTSCKKQGGRKLPEDNDKVVGQGTSFDEFVYNDDGKKVDFYDILEMLKLAMTNEDGDGEKLDLLETTAKQQGLEFPRPRWLHPDP